MSGFHMLICFTFMNFPMFSISTVSPVSFDPKYIIVLRFRRGNERGIYHFGCQWGVCRIRRKWLITGGRIKRCRLSLPVTNRISRHEQNLHWHCFSLSLAVMFKLLWTVSAFVPKITLKLRNVHCLDLKFKSFPEHLMPSLADKICQGGQGMLHLNILQTQLLFPF